MDNQIAQAARAQPSPRQEQHRQERERLQELYRTIRQLRAEPGLSALRQLLERKLAQAQSTLLRCPQAELPAVQAYARAYDEMLNDLFRDNAGADLGA